MFIDSDGRQELSAASAAKARPAAYRLTLRGARPLHFSGAALWFPLLAQLAEYEAGSVYRYLRCLNVYTLAFFNHHLLGLPAPLLDSPSAAYPEAVFA